MSVVKKLVKLVFYLFLVEKRSYFSFSGFYEYWGFNILINVKEFKLSY